MIFIFSSVILVEISPDAFLSTPNLTHLTCSQCWNLQPLPLPALQSLSALQFLDLSYSPHSLVGQQGLDGHITVPVRWGVCNGM